MTQNATHKVFVYGILKTPEHHAEPPTAVPGTMFVRGIALGKFVRGADSLIRGEVRSVDDSTLAAWDQIEGVDHERPARGMYRRIKVTTIDGERCWAYHYNGSVRGAQVAHEGVWLGYGTAR